MAAGCEVFIKPEEIQILWGKCEFPEGMPDCHWISLGMSLLQGV